ncbi:hypothetical protein LCGC14_0591410 [marine sediment metagenome]|uniref:Uncharacterized protein n=1 Tax=marine sediment metagenome TaxID=412755 RepID=A0A0F9RID8_9ZZZZ
MSLSNVELDRLAADTGCSIHNDIEHGLSIRKLAKLFSIGEGAVGGTLKRGKYDG